MSRRADRLADDLPAMVRCPPLSEVHGVDATIQSSAPDPGADSVDEGEFSFRDWPDGSLAAAVVRHREDAYAELVRRHSASVTAAIRMLLGNGPSSDDVVADVFAEFWFSAASFDPSRGSLLSFLRMRARSHSMDMLRSETSRRRREEDELFAGRDPAANVDSALLASEAAAAVRSAVSLLPPTEREVIQLAFFDGMSYRAVALHLGVAEGTVKSRIRAALRRLRLSDDVGVYLEMAAPECLGESWHPPTRDTASNLG